MWKKISSKIILKKPQITIYEDVVEIKKGVTAKYIRYRRRKGAVTIIGSNDENKFLFIKEYSYPSNSYLIQFPTGSIKTKGEDIISAGKRELLEETGYTANDIEIIGKFIIAKRRSPDFMYVVKAHILNGNSVQVRNNRQDEEIDEEITDIFWLDKSEINATISSGQIIDANTLACWSIYNSFTDRQAY